MPLLRGTLIYAVRSGLGIDAGCKALDARLYALYHFLGVEPFVLGPGMPARINPLGLGPLAEGWAQLSAQEARNRAAIVFSRWLTLMRALIGSQRIGAERVPFGPSEETVIKAALRDLTGYTAGNSTLVETTIPQLWHHLDQPTDSLIEQCRFRDRQHFFNETRLLRRRPPF